MPDGSEAEWSRKYRLWIDMTVAVVFGSAIAWLFGQSSSASVSIVLALLYGRSARKYEQARRQMEMAHAQEVQHLKTVLDEQQQDHLGMIRKMKLEQNQVLLKCHELQLSLRG